MEIWEILERKHAITVLLYIQKNPGVMQDKFLRDNKNGSRAKYNRLKDLIELSLIEEKSSDKHWNSLTYYTTDEGERIAKLLSKIESQEDENETNYGTPPGIRNKMKG